MRCCIERFVMVFCMSLLAQAQEGPVLDAGPERAKIDMSDLNPKVREAATTLDAIRDGEKLPAAEKWAVVCEACGLHPSLRSYAAETKPFPAVTTASLLTHAQFAVRMGALEILEERTGKDSSFDPWEPDSDASLAALKLWQDWAVKQEGGQVAEEPAVVNQAADEAKMRGYLVDLAGNDVSKQERAFQSMAREGMKAVAFLEQYLHDTPQLAEGARGRIKQAQYRLVLNESLPKEAARLARDLVYGTRDQKLAAMQPLPRCRGKAVPILAEYLPDADPLIREAAMDALILAGEESVYDLVQERLKVETDENVIHAVLRRVETNSERGARLIAGFMSSRNEDLVVASLNALSDGKSDAGRDGVMTCIADPRWRVRVAALEYAGKMKVTQAKTAVLAAFEDKDEFVRYAGMKAAADMALEEAVPRITKMALADDTLLGPATDAIVRMGRLLPDELVSALPGKSGESLLGVLRAFGKRAGHDGEHIEWDRLTDADSDRSEKAEALQALQIVRTLSKHRDPDVRAMAVQILAGILLNEEDRRLVYDALKTANAEERSTILESMQPGPFDFRESQLETSEPGQTGPASDIFEQVLREPPPRNEAQEAVYAAFGVKITQPAVKAPLDAAPGERTWGPMEREFHDLLVTLMTQKENADLAFHAATQLAFGGQQRAISEIHAMLPRLEPHQRARLASFLNMDSRLTAMPAGLALTRSLLQDESPEVRGDAVYAMLRKESPERVRMLLDEVSRPDGNLKAVNAYNYSLASATEQPRIRSAIEAWCKETLARKNVREDARTLALVLLGTAGKGEAAALVSAERTTSNVWQRRAAWRALMRLDRATFDAEMEKAASDSSPRVREVLAAAYLKAEDDSYWRVWFGERDYEEESMPYRQRGSVFALPDEAVAPLTRLAKDTDPLVRLQAMMTLLGHDRDADPLAFREAVAALAGEDERRALLEPFLEQHFRALTPRFAFLLDQVQKKWFDDRDWERMTHHLIPDAGSKKEGKALTSFASLVMDWNEPTPRVAKPAVLPVSKPVVAAVAPLRVLFFYKPGCKDCERIRDMLRLISGAQPLDIEEHNIERSEGAEINQTLCARFKVEPELHQVTPAVFTQAGALVKTQVTFNTLKRLVEKTSEQPVDPAWSRVDEQERQSAGEEIAQRFDSFSIGWVGLAGLLDGINPCAFATIIFFLSYLRVARRSPREILLVGMAFIVAVFVAYFAVGLGLSQLVAKLEAFAWVRTWLNRAMALVALVLSWLSFRDGIKALRGKIGESTLQLPEFLKTRIRSVIRVQAKSTHFVLAAFASGIVISLLELACTGQVYLPTIVYMMKQGSLTAVGYLLLYNVAFVLPLIVIFVFAWLGMTSEALITWQRKHTAAVRFATALLFLALWIVLLVA